MGRFVEVFWGVFLGGVDDPVGFNTPEKTSTTPRESRRAPDLQSGEACSDLHRNWGPPDLRMCPIGAYMCHRGRQGLRNPYLQTPALDVCSF